MFLQLLRHSAIGLFAFTVVAGCSTEPTTAGEGPEAVASTGAAEIANAASASSQASGAVTPERENWRKNMSKTALPKEGCFKASNPDTSWKEVTCGTPPQVPFGPAAGPAGANVGNRVDFSSEVQGAITWAEGSFPSVTGVTSVNSWPNGNCGLTADGRPAPCNSVYSLQLNSNTFFAADACSGAQDPFSCLGWQQFVYSDPALPCPGSGDESVACAFIQYWLLGYVNKCPSGWNTYGVDCWKNSNSSVMAPSPAFPAPPLNLANLVLTASAGTTDTVTVSTGDGNLYAMSQASMLGLNNNWTDAEFNIFGDADDTDAVFNDGATVVVRTLIDTQPHLNGAAAPFCVGEGFTGETNSLNLVPNSCCPISDPALGIQFTESNVSGAVPYGCQPFDSTWNFENAPDSGWSFGGNAGYDIDKGFAHTGNDDLWINASEVGVWNSVNVQFSPQVNGGGLCSVSGWTQTSSNFVNGVVNVWNANDGDLVFLTGWDIGASAPYTSQGGSFVVPQGVSTILLDYGFWGTGTPQWIRVDDVQVVCQDPN